MMSLFLISGMIGHGLGVEAFGDFQFANSVVFIFSSIGLICGAEVLIAKLVLAEDSHAFRIIGAGFILRLYAAIAAYILLLIYCYFFIEKNSTQILLAALGLSILFREPFSTISVWFQSKTNNKPIVLASIYGTTTKTCIVSLLYIYNQLTLWLLTSAWLAEAIILSVFYTKAFYKETNVKIRDIKFDFRIFKIIYKEGMLYWPPLILMLVFSKADRLLVKNIVDPYNAGLYMAAMQVIDGVISIGIIIATSAAPIFVYRYNKINEIKKGVTKLTLSMFFIGITLCGIGFTLSYKIIQIIYGETFIEATTIMQTGFFIVALSFIEASLNIYVIKELGGFFALKKWILITLISLPSEYFSIRSFGAQGAQIGILIGYMIAVIVGLIYIKKDNLKKNYL